MRKTSVAVTSQRPSSKLSPGRQRLLLALLTFSSLTSGGAALAAGGALPTGGHFVGGAGAITRGGNHLTVNQSTQLGIINWQSFSIGKGNSVTVANGRGATLNRVVGGDMTTIAGSLKSTGSVYIVNQAGVVVGPSGKVSTAGSFVASTRDVSDSAFMAGGKMVFSGKSLGTVDNQGTITSSNGDVVLVGKSVYNSGTINAANGSATLAAGDKVMLQASGDDAVLVETGSGDVTNSGTVEAAQVALNAVGGNVYALAVNNGGVIRATGTTTKDGHVYLTGGDDVTVGGTVAAANADGSGGTVEVTGQNVRITGKTRISANGTGKAAGGTVLIGGDRHGGAVRSQDLSKNSIANAQTTTIAPTASISANGGARGNGGNIVIWSDKTTKFAGHISAQAGGRGGDGGQVEVSSEGKLGFTGRVTTLARSGKTGMLLLDPQDVTIYSASDSNAPFTSTAASSYILNTTIDTMLASNNVTISTSGGTGGNGDIHFGTSGGSNGSNSAPIFWSSGFNLTLNADRLIDTPGGNPGSSTSGRNTTNPTTLVNALGSGQITFTAAGTGLTDYATDISLTGDIIGSGGTVSMISTGATYRIEVGNNTTVGNSTANGAGTIVLQGDEIRLGTLAGPTGIVTTPGEVDIVPTTAGAVTLGDIDTSGAFFNNDNTTLIRSEDMINITADLVVIGSTSTTSLSIVTANPSGEFTNLGFPIFDASNVSNLKFLTASNGSVTQDANTTIVVNDPALNGTGGTGGLAVESGTITLNNPGNSVGSIAFKSTNGDISFAGLASGTGTVNIGTVADVSGITTSGGAHTVTLAITGSTVTQSSGSTNAIAATSGSLALELTGSDSSFTLDNPANTVTTVAANVQALTFYDNVDLSTGTAGSTTGVTASGDVAIVDNGNLTIASGAGITSTGGNIKVEDQTFTNSDVGSAFSASSGTWRVYSQDPTQDSADTANLSYSFVQYGATNSYSDPFSTADAALDSHASGNGFLFTVSPTAAVTLTGTFDKNYDGTNAVTQTITNSVYGSVTGTINGDVVTFTSLSDSGATYSSKNAGSNLPITLSQTVAIASAVDSNSVTVYGYGSSVTNNLTGTISPLAITLTAGDQSKTYGQTKNLGSTNFSLTSGSLVGSESIDSATLTSTGTPATADAGTYAINISGATGSNGFLASNYTITYDPGTLTVNKAALTFTPKAVSVVYDGTTLNNTAYSDDVSNYTISGFQNSDNASNSGLTLSGSMAFAGSTSTTVKDVGTYSQGVGTLSLSSTNYTLTFTNPTPNNYVITPAPLTITASDQSKTYGQTKNLGSTAFTTSGLAGSESIDSATLSSTGTPATANAGSYAIDISSAVGSNGFQASNYDITYVQGTLTVNKAALTFTPKAVSVAYDGSTLNNTTYSDTLGNYDISGFQNSDNAGNSGLTLTGSMAFGGSTGTTVKNAATYSQGVGTLSLTSTNYTLSFSNPTPNNYVITPVALTITANDRTKTYGQTLSLGTSQFTVGSGLVGSESIDSATLSSTGAVATADAGTYAINASNATGSNGFLASNYSITYNPGTLTVNKAALTFTPKAVSVAYDGTTLNNTTYSDTLGNYTISGFQNSDNASNSGLTLTGSMAFGGSTSTTVKNAATYSQGVGTLSLTSTNYTLTFTNPTPNNYVITPAALTITANDRTKTYGQTLTLGSTAFTTSGLIGSETVDSATLTSTGAAASADAGSYAIGISSASGSNGFQASNYSITYNPGTLTVNPAPLTITIGDQSKTYGQVATLGTTGFTTGAGQLKNGDQVTSLTLASTGTSASANVGDYNITGSGPTGSGFNASNYSITYVTGTLTVDPATLTFTPVAFEKVYDGVALNNTTYSDDLGNYTITGYVNGQNATSAGISLSGSMAFDGSTTTVVKNAATYSQGVGSLTLTSAHGNYVLNFTNPHPNNYVITPATATLADLQGTRVYDGTTNADGSILSIVNLVSGDHVSVTGVGVLASKNVGKEQIVDLGTLTLTGADAGNYRLSAANPNDYVTVTPATLTISALTQTKVFDGTTVSTKTPTVVGLQTGDSITGTLQQSYDSRNVLGTNKSTLEALQDIGVSDGNGGKNYNIVYQTAKGTITPEDIVITAVTQTKVYDGTTTSTGTPTLTDGTLYNGDTLTGLAQAYNSKDVLGTDGSTLTVDPNYTLTHAGNYHVTLATAKGTITPLAITATGTRVYDSTTDVDGSILTITNLIGGDDVQISGTGTSSSPHVGTHNVTGDFTLTGGDAGNYTVVGGHETVKITPFAVVLFGTRVYDGGTDGDSSILAVTNAFKGDNVTVASGTSTIVSKNVGNENIVDFGTLTLGGDSAGDYTLVGATGVVKVTPEAITVTAVPGTKTYDGTETSTGTPIVTNGTIFTGDTGDFIQTYGSQHAGTDITLTPSGSVNDGNGGRNYTVTYVPITDGIIDPRPVDLIGTRPFDNDTDANSTILTITNLVPGDVVTVGGSSGAVISPNIGPEKMTDFTGLTLGGASSGDYTLVGATGVVTITPASTPNNNPGSQIDNQTASGNGTQSNFVTPNSGIVTLQPQQNGVVTGTIATIDGTDYHPDSQLGCTLGQAGCIQNGVAPTTTTAPQ